MDVAVKILHKSGDANALRMFYKEAALLRCVSPLLLDRKIVRSSLYADDLQQG
jgi:hypothetical protein